MRRGVEAGDWGFGAEGWGLGPRVGVGKRKGLDM